MSKSYDQTRPERKRNFAVGEMTLLLVNMNVTIVFLIV